MGGHLSWLHEDQVINSGVQRCPAYCNYQSGIADVEFGVFFLYGCWSDHCEVWNLRCWTSIVLKCIEIAKYRWESSKNKQHPDVGFTPWVGIPGFQWCFCWSWRGWNPGAQSWSRLHLKVGVQSQWIVHLTNLYPLKDRPLLVIKWRSNGVSFPSKRPYFQRVSLRFWGSFSPILLEFFKGPLLIYNWQGDFGPISQVMVLLEKTLGFIKTNERRESLGSECIQAR